MPVYAPAFPLERNPKLRLSRTPKGWVFYRIMIHVSFFYVLFSPEPTLSNSSKVFFSNPMLLYYTILEGIDHGKFKEELERREREWEWNSLENLRFEAFNCTHYVPFGDLGNDGVPWFGDYVNRVALNNARWRAAGDLYQFDPVFFAALDSYSQKMIRVIAQVAAEQGAVSSDNEVPIYSLDQMLFERTSLERRLFYISLRLELLQRWPVSEINAYSEPDPQSFCGGDAEFSFRFVTDPPGASFRAAPEFWRRYCRKMAKDVFSIDCERPIYLSNDPEGYFSQGTYYIDIDWPNGDRTCLVRSIVFSDDADIYEEYVVTLKYDGREACG